MTNVRMVMKMETRVSYGDIPGSTGSSTLTGADAPLSTQNVPQLVENNDMASLVRWTIIGAIELERV